jgi:NAD(P)-dependent dehydrogenase (short-subunit alcohol dehydrogenase family)
MKRLDGQVAVVTGASRGIGRACAEELAREGAAVVVNYFTNPDGADQVVGEIVSNGGRAIAVRAGVGHPDDCKALIEKTIETYGQIDILINNAGVNRDRTLKRLSVDEWNEVINTDLNSAFYCTSAAIPHMVERNYGRIIVMSSIIGQMGNSGQSNYAAAKAGLIAFAKSAAIPHMVERNYGRIIVMSSIIGQMGNSGQSNYAAAKAGLIAFAKSAAKELARNNITVNAMCPGFVETDMVMALSDDVKATLLKAIPLGRFGKPEEVASFVRYLCTEGDWITGQQFNPNGGQYM